LTKNGLVSVLVIKPTMSAASADATPMQPVSVAAMQVESSLDLERMVSLPQGAAIARRQPFHGLFFDAHRLLATART
jgi:hypothetical protein